MKHPMKGLLTKAQAEQMAQIIKDNGARLRWAMVDTNKQSAYENPYAAAIFMSGVAAGIMVTLHWLGKTNGKAKLDAGKHVHRAR